VGAAVSSRPENCQYVRVVTDVTCHLSQDDGVGKMLRPLRLPCMHVVGLLLTLGGDLLVAFVLQRVA